MKYYVVADVHGFCSVLIEDLKKAGFFEDKGPKKLIVCGDLLDRGEEAVKLVEFMMELLSRDELIFVTGNHEDLFVSCLQKIASGMGFEIASGMSVHYRNGTWNSLLQIAGMGEVEAYENPEELLKRVMVSSFYRVLLREGVDYYETEHYIFVHGWIPCETENEGSALESFKYLTGWRECDSSEWKKARWHNGMKVCCSFGVREPEKTIVCGHWHAAYGHAVYEGNGTERGENAIHKPFYADGIIAIDARTCESKEVNVLVIED